MTTSSHRPETVLVTGGGGFLGAAVVRRLVARGDRVRSFARRPHPSLEPLGVEQVQGDIADPQAIDRACAGVDVVHHTAAKPPPWGRPRDYHRVNVVGTENVIAACRRGGVGRLVHTSTPSVVFTGRDLEGVDESTPYPERYPTAYARTKAAAERAVVRAGTTGALATIACGRTRSGAPGTRTSPRASSPGRRAAADRRRPQPRRHDLHRQRGRGPCSRRRPPARGPAAVGPRLFHQPGRAGRGLGHDRRHIEGGRPPPGPRPGLPPRRPTWAGPAKWSTRG